MMRQAGAAGGQTGAGKGDSQGNRTRRRDSPREPGEGRFARVTTAYLKRAARWRRVASWRVGGGVQSALLLPPKIENARDRSPWRFPDAFAVHRIMHRPVRLFGPGSEFPLPRSLRFGPTLQLRSPCSARLGSHRRRSSELPRLFSLFCRASGWIFESPRFSHPSAWLSANRQVAQALHFLPCRR